MRKLPAYLALGLELVVLGANDAKAVCVDFNDRCDCLTVNTVPGGAITRTYGIWQNQDCAGTTSPMQGMLRSGAATMTGEANSILGLDGVNWSFTINAAALTYDLDSWDGVSAQKWASQAPFTLLGGD